MAYGQGFRTDLPSKGCMVRSLKTGSLVQGMPLQGVAGETRTLGIPVRIRRLRPAEMHLRRIGAGLWASATLLFFWPLFFFLEKTRFAPRVRGEHRLLLESRATGRLRHNQEWLWVDEQGSRIAKSDIQRGWVVPMEGAPYVVLELKSGLRFLFGVPDLAAARQVLALGGVSLAQQRLRMPLASRARVAGRGFLFHWLVVYAAAASSVAAVRLCGRVLGVAPAVGAMAMVVMAFVFYGIWRALLAYLLPARIQIGGGGFELKQPFKARFVSYEHVQAIERSGASLLVHVQGETIRLGASTLTDRSLGRIEAVELRLREAWSEFLNRQAYRTSVSQLERGQSSFDSWMNRLRQLAQNQDYRSQSLTSDQLTEVASDPGARSEHRIAAFVALSSVHEPPSPETDQQLRIAVEGCAKPHLRRALDAALRKDWSEKEYQAALAEAEEDEEVARVRR